MTDRQPMKSSRRSNAESSGWPEDCLEQSRELKRGDAIADRYLVERLIGSGGMSDVWLARDTVLGSDVAVKILSEALALKSDFAELMATEADTLAELKHPNIVRVFASGCHGQRFYIVLERLLGDSLLAVRGAGWRQIVETVLPIAGALEYAHERGVVHRDLKPGNILFDAAGEPHLTDFGIAARLDVSAAHQLRSGGSLPAMSPQQLDGELPSFSDDIYGFGALLYDLLSGAPLFTPAADAEAVRHQIPRSVSDMALAGPVPPELNDLVQATLAKLPEQRPAAMRDCRKVLEHLLRDAPDPAVAML